MGAAKGQKTKPRRLHPLLLRDMHETITEWKLQAQIQIGEQLPPLNSQGEGGQAFGMDLRRRDALKRLRAQAEPEAAAARDRTNRRTIVKWWDRPENLLRKVVHTSPIEALHHRSQFQMTVLVQIR